jgi:hypothetical protein
VTESQRKPPTVPLRPVIFLLIVFAAVLAVVAASQFMTAKERVPWRSDLPAALANRSPPTSRSCSTSPPTGAARASG